jgi:hypothetical protein
MTTHVATCSCGKLQARCAGEPALVSVCHCKACRQRTGSAFGVAAFFSRSIVEIRGDSRSFTRPSDGGFSVTFHFCPACGSTVFWEPARKPDVIAIAAGAFADSNFPVPSREVYTDDRCSWISLQVPGQM